MDQKQAKKLAQSLIDVFSTSIKEKEYCGAGRTKEPLLKKKEIEALEAEISELKSRLNFVSEVNKQILKKFPVEQDE